MPEPSTTLQLLRLGALLLTGAAIAFLLSRGVAQLRRGRSRAEQLLRTSQAQLAGILEIAADAIIVIDQTQSILHFNHGAEEIFGYRAAEMIGQPLEILLPESAVGTHRSHVANFAVSGDSARRMGARREVAGRRRNGTEFPAEASISKLPTPTGMLFCVVLRDATEQKRREAHEHILAIAGARLAGSLDLHSTLREATELPVPAVAEWCLLDVIEPAPTGGTSTLRRVASLHHDPARDAILRALESRGLDWDSPSAVIDVLRTGQPLWLGKVEEEWLEAHHDSPDAIRELRRLGADSLLIVPLLAHDEVFGAMTMGRSTGRPPFDEADLTLARAIGFRVALAVDNALHYRAEQRATLARNEMLAIVSHDLRNPANAISMCAQALTESPGVSSQDQAALLVTIAESAEWMRRLMQDLVDVASIEAGRLSVTPEQRDPGPILQATMDMFRARAAAASRHLRAEIPASLPQVNADHARVMQVLANLLDNALKFTPEGGEITLGATVRENEVEFSVHNTGAGVPSEYLPHLFDRFWHARGNSHTHGSGLGLAIARGIVSAHGGRIWVDPEAGPGATFRFTLPVAG